MSDGGYDPAEVTRSVIPGRAIGRTTDAQLRIGDLEIPGLVLRTIPE
jgi:hypothetical protein